MTRAKRHTVLVVDDEPDVIQSVKDLLRFDHHVVGATRAAEGLALMAQQEVHVVMTDQRMPEMSGVEFLHQIRGDHPDAIRLLFTGYADLRAVIEAINQGNVYRYVTKPWDPEDLQSVIREACERYDLLVDRKRLVYELQTRNDDLERVSALKSAFLRVVGHELRTPITLQLGLSQLALRTEGLAPPAVRDWLERIERATQRLHRRSEQLITLLYGESLASTLERQPTDMAALLREVAHEVMPFVERRRQTLTVDVAPDLGDAPVDAPKIEDGLHQLLLNAIKFTPDGGAIALSAARRGDGVRIEVRDSGVGIPAASREHLFEPFFTGLDAAHHSSGQFEFNARGLGLGLSVVKAFVEMHGGAVACRSEVGRGSVFTVDLPAVTAAGASAAAP